jgi:serine/tyrosine/threonine adenylyltransferase
LTRLGEALGELMGSMSHVDEPEYISGDYTEGKKSEVISNGERIIEHAGEKYKGVFLENYIQLMTRVSA